jgi:four helix bundle protein
MLVRSLRRHLRDSERTQAAYQEFALDIIKLTRTLSSDPVTREIALQLVRSASSVAANYRASCRGRSTAEFIARMGVVEEEADEAALWLEILVADNAAPRERIAPFLEEANQLVRIVVASIKTARANAGRRQG